MSEVQPTVVQLKRKAKLPTMIGLTKHAVCCNGQKILYLAVAETPPSLQSFKYIPLTPFISGLMAAYMVVVAPSRPVAGFVTKSV